MAPNFEDDKLEIAVPFVLKRFHTLRLTEPSRPIFVGLNGLQGIGKTTFAASLATELKKLRSRVLVCSIDDFYLTHQDQQALAAKYPNNALWQHRGEPGTHDISLARDVITSLLANTPTPIPQYDKAAFSGQGDRLPRSLWQQHPQQQHDDDDDRPLLDILILEGWCVGFRPLTPDALETKHNAPSRTLRSHSLDHLRLVNDKLAEYDETFTNLFDAFIHIDTEDLSHVYRWRREQEEHLRRARGDPDAGMSDEQVDRFVDGYFPAYELYVDDLRAGVFADRPKSQLRLVVDRDRELRKVRII